MPHLVAVTQERDLTWFLGAGTVSTFGSQITVVALPATAIITLGTSVTPAALLVLAEFLPGALMGLAFGPVIDRSLLRRVTIPMDLLRASVLAIVACLIYAHRANYWQLLMLAVILSGAGAVFDGASEAVLTSLVPREGLAKANSTRGLLQNSARLLGPATGGLLVSALGSYVALSVDALTFLISGFMLIAIRTSRMRQNIHSELASSDWWQELKSGLRYLRRNDVLWRGALGMALLNSAGAGIGSVFFFYAYNDLALTPAQVGFTVALFSLGSILGAASSPAISERLGPGTTCAYSASLATGALFLIPLAVSLPALAAIAAYQICFGLAATLWSIVVATMRQSLTPEDYIGRVAATSSSLIYLATPAGVMIAALVSQYRGVGTALWALCVLALATPSLYWFGGFRGDADAAGKEDLRRSEQS